MKRIILFLLVLLIFAGIFVMQKSHKENRLYGAPPYIQDNDSDEAKLPGFNRFSDLLNWKRPDGPLRVGLQAGHWKNNELPDELEKIRGNSGASSLQVAEWQVNLAIAQAVKNLLEKEAIVVDILPATIPVSYWADAFVAIHADGNLSSQKKGFKVASSWRDYSGRANELVKIIDKIYEEQMGFENDINITRNMKGYYAFSWWRFEHAVHPKTPAVILETGFLTNPYEAGVLIDNPEKPAKAIADALKIFLNTE